MSDYQDVIRGSFRLKGESSLKPKDGKVKKYVFYQGVNEKGSHTKCELTRQEKEEQGQKGQKGQGEHQGSSGRNSRRSEWSATRIGSAALLYCC